MIATNRDIKQYFNTNLSDEKRKYKAHLDSILFINDQLDEDDICVIRQHDFYDDLHSGMDIEELLDEHYLGHLDVDDIEALKALTMYYLS